VQDALDRTDALCVQTLLGIHRPKVHQGITDLLFLLRRHESSIQFGFSVAFCGESGLPNLPESRYGESTPAV
jgi:hypothetical protein